MQVNIPASKIKEYFVNIRMHEETEIIDLINIFNR